ncbi:flagellar hook-associated protein FlgK [Mangrovibacter plantisponsor]|uniref:Flagellar hook-associated protein 1 n=1 Tax=Mangrovibacter plantisponsor TaxID=451513 RepID=A0A317PJM1_9ENTR|nr:flagellar hook-associated protein FlgK [Mangrovibacter plantisponsor]PWW00817.1 flagellar hook-associated protein 1 FlgK [Mangrovibacter plantisponsor]
MNMINTAYSGLQTAQMGMNVTAMNVANMLTPGYSRQGIVQSAVGPYGTAQTGNGVQVDSIRRISSQYLVSQVWHTSSQASYYQINQQYFSALEQVIGNDSTSIGNGLDDFFSALSELTTQPESPALRQQFLNQSRALATRFNNTQDMINSQRMSINSQRDATVSQVNTLTSGIAEYNQKIAAMESAGGNSSVLRDQRDELVRELSLLTEVNVVEDSHGYYNVSMKSGQPLVSGTTAGQMSSSRDENGLPVLSLQFADHNFPLPPSPGGQLGALYDYETGTLNTMETALQGMAEALAQQVNEQLAQGYDLNGNPGKPLFSFDPGNPAGMLQVNTLSPDELALSGAPGEPGNGDNLQFLLAIQEQKMDLPGLGNMSLAEGSAAMVSTLGIASRNNQTELTASLTILEQALQQRDNLSAVNQDEEAINLQIYMQAYQSNMKVISAGNQLFSDLLGLF